MIKAHWDVLVFGFAIFFWFLQLKIIYKNVIGGRHAQQG